MPPPTAWGFLSWTRGPGEVLAETCQLVLFDPTLLSCAKKRGVEPPRRNCYFTLARKYTRVCGPLCDPNGSNQATPALSSASTVFASTLALVCNCTPVCSSYNDQTAGQLIWQSFAAARHFCSAKILAGGLRWGWGPRRSRQRHRPRKEISRGNLLCAKSGLTNLSYPRRLSAQKYVTLPDWENLCTGQPQGARGTAVPLFREESRGTPSKGFLWATSSRRLDTALLFADKKRGVETTRLAGHCQSTPGPRTTGPAKKLPAAALDSKALAAGRQQKNRRTFVRRFSLPYLLLYALMPRASRSMARSSLSCLRM